MKKTFPLFLESYGYLEDIEQKDDKTIARICMEPLLSDSNTDSDEIALYCTVETPLLLFIVKQLESRRLAGHSMELKFSATYSHFGNCFAGRTLEGSENILLLHCKLLSIKGWFQDGNWVFPESLAWEAVRSVLGALPPLHS